MSAVGAAHHPNIIGNRIRFLALPGKEKSMGENKSWDREQTAP
jgi:hypothetical protein